MSRKHVFSNRILEYYIVKYTISIFSLSTVIILSLLIIVQNAIGVGDKLVIKVILFSKILVNIMTLGFIKLQFIYRQMVR